MPNKFTAALDAVENTYTSVHFFDAIFGEWNLKPEHIDKWRFLQDNGMTFGNTPDIIKKLFWCFIAELSDQDLQECFPELFSDMYPEQQKD